MAHIIKDRVKQKCTAPSGSDPFDFTGSATETGFQTFVDALANGDTCLYSAFDSSGNWETGLGTWTEASDQLARTTILASSNSGSAETFSGTVTVAITMPARDVERSFYSSRAHIEFDTYRYFQYVDSDSVRIKPGKAVVNGALLTWTSDLDLNMTSGVAPLNATGLVYVYLYSSSGTPTLEGSTTAPEYSEADGYYRKTSDSTRRCVGYFYVWQTSGAAYRVAPFEGSWLGGRLAEVTFAGEYVDASNAWDSTDQLVVNAGAETGLNTATSFTLTFTPAHAVAWACLAKIDWSTASASDAFLGIHFADRTNASATVVNECFYVVRNSIETGSGVATFFGTSWIPIRTARTAYYTLHDAADVATCRIHNFGARFPL